MTFDHSIGQFFVSLHHPLLTRLMWAATSLGSELFVGVATLVVLVGTFVTGRRRDTAMVAFGMAGASAFTLGVKHLVQRARPSGDFRVPGAAADHSYSFPSGHTLHATVFVILLVAVLGPVLSSARTRAIAWSAAAFVACAVGFSRLYLGYHWATDVIASLLIGTVWGLAVVRIATSTSRETLPASKRKLGR